MTTEEQFRERTKQFALEVLRAAGDVPGSLAGNVLVKQLIRSATSVGANYRAACHARSKPDFIAKLSIAQEECDESVYWIELLGALELFGRRRCIATARRRSGDYRDADEFHQDGPFPPITAAHSRKNLKLKM